MFHKVAVIAAVLIVLGNLGVMFGERPDPVGHSSTLKVVQADQTIDVEKDVERLEDALMASEYGKFVDLLRAGANPNAFGSHGYAAVHIAAQHQNSRYLERVLEHGGNPNLPARRLQRSPLYNALDSRRPENRDLLIENGADIEYQDAMRQRPLQHAAAIMDVDSVVRFLELGADPSAADDLGTTFQSSLFRPDPKLLTWSALRQYRKIIRILDEQGVPVDSKAERYR